MTPNPAAIIPADYRIQVRASTRHPWMAYASESRIADARARVRRLLVGPVRSVPGSQFRIFQVSTGASWTPTRIEGTKRIQWTKGPADVE